VTAQDAREAGGPVAIVGASESMPWSYWLIRNLEGHGFTGPIWPVNPNHPQVHGRSAFPKVGDLPGAPASGVCLLRPDLAEPAVSELLEAGCQTVVLVSNGFRETGDADAARRERRIAAACRSAGARLIGPNCVGFADFPGRQVLIAEPLPAGVRPGPVSVASQSGALLSCVIGAIGAAGSGIDRAYSLGNGASFDVVDAAEEFTSSATARVLVLVLEGISEPRRFAAAVRAAHAAGKRVVALRLGRSDRAAALALSHTGTVAGPGLLTGAWLNELGVVTADTIEELSVLVPLIEHAPAAGGRGVLVMTSSGGAAGYAIDLAAAHGAQLAELGPATVAKLRTLLPAGTFAGNPLDVVGAPPQTKAVIRDLVYADPSVGLVIEPYALPWPDEDPSRRWFRAGLMGLAESARASGTPTVVASAFGEPPSDWVLGLRNVGPLVVGASLQAALGAVAKVFPRRAAGPAAAAGRGAPASQDVVAEAEARELLSGLGFPMIAGSVAADAAAAAELAGQIGGPVAVKAAVTGLAHKGRVGGVRLDRAGAQAVLDACAEITAGLRSNGIQGPVRFLIQEMARGPEILVGLVRDRTAGPTVTLGLGGWAAELAGPLATLALTDRSSWSPDRIDRVLASCGLRAALGAEAAGQLGVLVSQLSEDFTVGGLASWQTVECNPVVLTPDGPRIVDALLISGDSSDGISS
jgi:acyl-CoA synthetase (NDP forming)